MSLISKSEFAKVAKLDRLKLSSLSGMLMQLLRIEKLNHIYDKHAGDSPVVFVDQILNELNVNFELSEGDKANLPQGPFITVSNHPLGGLEGLILMKLLKDHDSQSKVMANFLLSKIPQLESHIIGVEHKGENTDLRSSVAGYKATLALLGEGHPVGVFPAGEVSALQDGSNTIMDKPWEPAVMKLIRKAGVPVVPIYFKGTNSLLFHLLGRIHPLLRTARLPSELFNKKRQTIIVRIGKAIKAKEISAIKDPEALGQHLRAKTYALEAAIPRKRMRERIFPKRLAKQQEIEEAIPDYLIEKDVLNLPKERLLMEQNEFQVYLAPAPEIPSLLHEIGRQREITFRTVGEGTNLSIDLDPFDIYYLHLFVWDKQAKKLVGAYRIGEGDKIMKQYGKRGFYIYTLFRLSSMMKPYLKRSLELGRSFIVPQYQKKIYPLFLLWKGILKYALDNPQHRFLIGPVSISNQYTDLSRKLIVNYVNEYHNLPKLASYVKPRHPFKPKLKRVDTEALMDGASDFQSLDEVVKYIEANHNTSPVLLKKYLKQGAYIIGFNVDPDFNNALDGFIFLDVKKLPESAKKDLLD